MKFIQTCPLEKTNNKCLRLNGHQIEKITPTRFELRQDDSMRHKTPEKRKSSVNIFLCARLGHDLHLHIPSYLSVPNLQRFSGEANPHCINRQNNLKIFSQGIRREAFKAPPGMRCGSVTHPSVDAEASSFTREETERGLRAVSP